MQDATALTRIRKALAYPLREHMLWLLQDGERCGCEFEPELEVDPCVTSRWLGLLERAGLVRSRRKGVV